LASERVAAIVFDLGGVLIDWNPRHLYRRLFHGDEAAMEAFLADVCTADWNAQLDAGRPFLEAVETLAAARPGQRDLILAYATRWNEMMAGEIEGTVAVLGELMQAHVPLYVLSNWSAETFPAARSRFPFLDWFDGVVISGDLGICKPDPAIYADLVARYRLVAARTVFIDDAETNVAVANRLGMIGLRFEGAPRLRADLRGLGLPVESDAGRG
jgi:2-haloacid dehalogenase